jgi:hypothetical protein
MADCPYWASSNLEVAAVEDEDGSALAVRLPTRGY